MAETAVSANVFFLEMPIPLNLRGSLQMINHNLMSKCYTVFFGTITNCKPLVLPTCSKPVPSLLVSPEIFIFQLPI